MVAIVCFALSAAPDVELFNQAVVARRTVLERERVAIERNVYPWWPALGVGLMATVLGGAAVGAWALNLGETHTFALSAFAVGAAITALVMLAIAGVWRTQAAEDVSSIDRELRDLAQPIPLPPPPAILDLRASDSAEVVVDGRSVGPSPQLGLRVKPGRHEIRFDCYDENGDLTPGEVQSVDVGPASERDVSYDCPLSP
jgi:hypothetical protein